MPRTRANQRTLSRAAALLAVVALVLSLLQAGPAAMAASLVMYPVADHEATHAPDDCAHHAAQHEAAHDHVHLAVIAADAEAQPDDGQSHPAPGRHHHTHPCCVSGVSIVLPALAILSLPAASGGHRVLGDVAERLEKRAPEGPNEPPRTADMS